MCWSELERKARLFFPETFMSSLSKVERKLYIQLIEEEFPQLPRIRIAAILDRESKRIKEPVTRMSFLSQLKSMLR